MPSANAIEYTARIVLASTASRYHAFIPLYTPVYTPLRLILIGLVNGRYHRFFSTVFVIFAKYYLH